jgi:hypothetical protein
MMVERHVWFALKPFLSKAAAQHSPWSTWRIALYTQVRKVSMSTSPVALSARAFVYALMRCRLYGRNASVSKV